ncbi:hypothetical protein A33K_13332 [Burkholderia humptydooensis MSMB43]|uniref:Uncharacterized protein n=1 Tax=Burkholderia humptydooensis MSMB43 TaxID=441157 RepID=A0ABN0GCB3_9BURK|nr:hypothetical protein A33K_13332 [Burkholderia humptydooensis MSMB43]
MTGPQRSRSPLRPRRRVSPPRPRCLPARRRARAALPIPRRVSPDDRAPGLRYTEFARVATANSTPTSKGGPA